FVGAYIADKFDNPLQGETVTFTSQDCTSACVNIPGDSLITAPDTSKTDSRGIVEGNWFALHSGPRTFKGTLSTLAGPYQDNATLVAAEPDSNEPPPALSTATIIADPGHTTHITITLLDANDNPTPNQDLELDAHVNTAGGAVCTACTFSLPVNTDELYE